MKRKVLVKCTNMFKGHECGNMFLTSLTNKVLCSKCRKRFTVLDHLVEVDDLPKNLYSSIQKKVVKIKSLLDEMKKKTATASEIEKEISKIEQQIEEELKSLQEKFK